MNRENAETIGLKALAWLARNDELLPVFLGSTGASLDELRSRAGEAEFLGPVLDFILMDDDWVLAFSEAAVIDPSDLLAARQVLPGGEAVHWT